MNKTLEEIFNFGILPEPNPYGTTLTVKKHNQLLRKILLETQALFQEEMKYRKEIAKKLDITFANLDSKLTKRDYLEISFLKDSLFSPKLIK